MGYTALRIPRATKDKYDAAKKTYPRVPLSHVADAVIDGWNTYLTPEERDACIGKPVAIPRRRGKATA